MAWIQENLLSLLVGIGLIFLLAHRGVPCPASLLSTGISLSFRLSRLGGVSCTPPPVSLVGFWGAHAALRSSLLGSKG